MPRIAELAERAETWLYTGPVGRVLAFAGDLGGAWWRWARGLDPSTRPERRVPRGAPTDEEKPAPSDRGEE